jgi:PAT family beta-lactamase induction signal transducer AmpG
MAFFLLLGVCSATHDIAADGFYLLALSEHYQTFFSGVRNTFYRVAMIGAQGGLVILVARWFRQYVNYVEAWRLGLLLSALFLFSFGLYHCFILPRPAGDLRGIIAPQIDEDGSRRDLATSRAGKSVFAGFFEAFVSFFKKPNIVLMLTFLLLYRLGEAQLVKIAPLFLIADRSHGGLGLAQEQLGWIYGTIGLIALLAGGLAGGFLASRHGLKAWLWPMLFAIHLPDAVFIWLAHAQPQNLLLIEGGVVVEQFGYGFGFSAFMLYMIYMARGRHQTSHYALCTGFMALGMMLPGMVSGRLQEYFGYEHFFVWVILATVPSFVVAAIIPLDREFGKGKVG